MSYAAHLGFQATPGALSQSQVPSSPSTPTPGRGCCENGRPVLTDPHTGQSVCSCQYSSALLGYSRLPGLTSALFPPGAYSPGAASQGYTVSLGSEGSAFYTPLAASGANLRDSTEAWRSLTQPSLYDTTAMGFYPYGSYGGLDLNARRKNATRESTNTLKAWLHEHIKNPYPTKGEKIMLAIITKMTLTQVSTWFANARRRLKKENKMTWSPRNRSESGEDDDDDEDKAGDGDIDDNDKRLNQRNSREEEIDVENTHTTLDHHSDGGSRKPGSKPALNHSVETDCISPAPSIGEDSRSRLSPPQSRDSYSGYNLEGHTPSDFDGDQQKPKIWSVSDFLLPGKISKISSNSINSHPNPNNSLTTTTSTTPISNTISSSSTDYNNSSSNKTRSDPSSCRESGMKMDTMRCVPISPSCPDSAMDLTGKTVAVAAAAASVAAAAAAAHAHAHAHAHVSALSARGAAGGFFPPMTSLPTPQHLGSYQSALANYAVHTTHSPFALASAAEMSKLVMRPMATRLSPYSSPKQAQGFESHFPPPRDFSVVREGD